MKRSISVILFLVLAVCSGVARDKKIASDNHGLVVRGEVLGLVREHKDDRILIHVKLNTRFTNQGTQPIILFKPAVDAHRSGYWLGGWSLYLTEEKAKQKDPIFADGYWESISGSDFYRNLSNKLDVEAPPSEQTKILAPNETWEFPDQFQIYFESEKHTRIPEHRTWEEMQEFSPRLWLSISYEISPWNVEYFKPNLIRKLSKRWKQFGSVLVESNRDDRLNNFVISSEAMPIDFSQAVANSAAPR